MLEGVYFYKKTSVYRQSWVSKPVNCNAKIKIKTKIRMPKLKFKTLNV